MWSKRLFHTLHLRILFFFCALLALGCRSPDPSPQKTETILSLYPAITETIHHLGAESYLIGRSDYCSAPAEAKKLPAFGSSLTPNFEAIARQKPDLILTDLSAGTETDSLKMLAPVSQLPWLSVGDMERSILTLGDILKKQEAAQELSTKLAAELRSSATPNSPTMLMLMGSSDIQKGQLWFMRHDSIHGAVIEAAGYQNAAPKSFSGPPSMSLEQLIAQDPDIILFISSAPMDEEAIQTRIQSLQILPTLKAVQTKKIAVISGENLMGVGPSIIELLAQVRKKGQELSERK